MIYLSDVRPVGATILSALHRQNVRREAAPAPAARKVPDRRAAPFAPPIELSETAEAYEIAVELPGVDPATIELTLIGDELAIRGEKLVPARPEGALRHVSELRAGAFERKFVFPTPVAADGVSAEARLGVLRVKVAKAPETVRRTIPITIAS